MNKKLDDLLKMGKKHKIFQDHNIDTQKKMWIEFRQIRSELPYNTIGHCLEVAEEYVITGEKPYAIISKEMEKMLNEYCAK